MDLKIIKALTDLMSKNDLVELQVESADLKVRLAKAQPTVFATPVAAPVAAAPVAAAAPALAPAAAAEDAAVAGAKEVISPIPGTYYSKSNPEAPAYVKVGDSVKPGQVLCLIEAMKVFNEIKAEIGGTVKKVCLNDGQPVEYGTVLFYIG